MNELFAPGADPDETLLHIASESRRHTTHTETIIRSYAPAKSSKPSRNRGPG